MNKVSHVPHCQHRGQCIRHASEPWHVRHKTGARHGSTEEASEQRRVQCRDTPTVGWDQGLLSGGEVDEGVCVCTRECMPLLPRTCVSHKPWLPADKKVKSPELFRGILFTSLSLSWLVSIATHHDSTTRSFSHRSECTQRQAPARRIREKF